MSELIDDTRPGGPISGGPTDDELASPGDVSEGRDGGGSIADRIGRDPGNLGGEVADQGDVTHPVPEPDSPQM